MHNNALFANSLACATRRNRKRASRTSAQVLTDIDPVNPAPRLLRWCRIPGSQCKLTNYFRAPTRRTRCRLPRMRIRMQRQSSIRVISYHPLHFSNLTASSARVPRSNPQEHRRSGQIRAGPVPSFAMMSSGFPGKSYSSAAMTAEDFTMQYNCNLSTCTAPRKIHGLAHCHHAPTRGHWGVMPRTSHPIGSERAGSGVAQQDPDDAV